MTIYWVRHAEAEGNLYRRCHGQYNSCITENGREQLAALARRFKDVRLDAVVSSDLYRAWATGNALASPRGLMVVTHPGLREIRLGEWEDRTWEEIGQRWGGEYHTFNNLPCDFRSPGGESMIEARDRVLAALDDIERRFEGQNIAVVSHGAVTRAAMARLSGLEDCRITDLHHGDNTSVSMLRRKDKGFEPEYYADNGHLGEKLSTLARQHWWREGQGGREHGFCFRTVDYLRDSTVIEEFRRDAWRTIYGGLEQYNPDVFLREARSLSLTRPESVMFAVDGDEPAGMLQMDFDNTLKPGTCHISFFYLTPRNRNRGLGVQVLGQAVSLCRSKGLGGITLRVFDGNAHAVNFYQRNSFVRFGEEPSFSGKLILMELAVSVPPMNPSEPWR